MREPCDDLDCQCCWPDLTCDCTGRCHLTSTASGGDHYTCPQCGAVWLAVDHDDLPAHVREVHERSLAIVAAALARKGRVLPPQPTVTWQRTSPPVRIPGSAR